MTELAITLLYWIIYFTHTIALRFSLEKKRVRYGSKLSTYTEELYASYIANKL